MKAKDIVVGQVYAWELSSYFPPEKATVTEVGIIERLSKGNWGSYKRVVGPAVRILTANCRADMPDDEHIVQLGQIKRTWAEQEELDAEVQAVREAVAARHEAEAVRRRAILLAVLENTQSWTKTEAMAFQHYLSGNSTTVTLTPDALYALVFNRRYDDEGA